MKPIPLCIDLDGTLCRSDTLVEAFLRLLKRDPLQALWSLAGLLRGRAAFKRRVMQSTELDWDALPWRADLVAWLQEQHAAGRRLVLATGADARTAHAVAGRFGCFAEVLCSDGVVNLTGSRKRAALESRYGAHGFDYAGNDAKDLTVWPAARQAVVVGGSPAFVARVQRLAPVERSFPGPQRRLRAWGRALRLHQWVKNLLVLLPLALAHRADPALLAAALVAFLAFGLCASSGYLLNDLLDLDSDRRHPRKRHRPFAAADLPLARGIVAAPALLLAALLLAATVTPAFLAMLVLYYALTTAYSLALKRAPIVDVITLAGLYTLRVIAGAAATGLPLSFWLLAFSMFLFLSLGVVKRYAELDQAKSAAQPGAHGRGYHVDDLPLLSALGVSAGYGAVLVLALYVNSPESQLLYRHPQLLWLLCPLVLYWISYIWMKTHRGRMHDDPIVFALRDRSSLGIAVLAALVVVCAALLP